MNEGKTFCIDIDGVIASIVPDNDYTQSQPQMQVIEAINRLHAQGHEIILFTARGSKTGIDWSEHTRQQLEAWGVRYHELRFGKPAADYYIDDRMLAITDLLAFPMETTGRQA